MKNILVSTATQRRPHDDGDGPLTRATRRYPFAIDQTANSQTSKKTDNNNNVNDDDDGDIKRK